MGGQLSTANNGSKANNNVRNAVLDDSIPNMGNVSSPIAAITAQQQQAMSNNMSPVEAMHATARTEMKNASPSRPERLGDVVPVVGDVVKQAEAAQRAQDAMAQQQMQQAGVAQPRLPSNIREGRYSIYNNPVACSGLPNVFPLDDCLRSAQHQFFEAQQALRYQRQMCLPCNQCYGDYSMGGGAAASAFGADNNVVEARTNDAMMSREHRTMMANLQARRRLVQQNARPSQLEYSEATTKKSPAAQSIEALASRTASAAQERNALAAEARVVEQSMSPIAVPAASGAATGAAPAAASNAVADAATASNGNNGNTQSTASSAGPSPVTVVNDANWQQMQQQQRAAAWRASPSASPACGCAGARAQMQQRQQSTNCVKTARLLALKRMQQGIQSRQDFCECDFCPVN